MQGSRELLDSIPTPSELVEQELKGDRSHCALVIERLVGRSSNTGVVVSSFNPRDVLGKGGAGGRRRDLALESLKVVIDKRDDLLSEFSNEGVL